MNSDEAYNLTGDQARGISAISSCSWAQVRGAKNGMGGVERRNFDYTNLVGEYPDLMTYEQVYKAFEPYADFTSEQVQALRKRFQGTPIEEALLDMPEDGAIAVDSLHEWLGELYRGGCGLAGVHAEEVAWKVGEKFYTDEKYHPDWLGRAIVYRLAATQLVPDLPIEDLDDLTVIFTPLLKNNRQCMLSEETYGFVDRSLDRSNRGLFVKNRQYRIFELDHNDAWQLKDTLTFFQVGQVMHLLGYPEDAEDVFNCISVILNTPLSAQHFDRKTMEDFQDMAPVLFAPMPQDLQPPEDLPYSIY